MVARRGTVVARRDNLEARGGTMVDREMVARRETMVARIMVARGRTMVH